jgi:hypothetical protein
MRRLPGSARRIHPRRAAMGSQTALLPFPALMTIATRLCQTEKATGVPKQTQESMCCFA